jgi:hypothetical protein
MVLNACTVLMLLSAMPIRQNREDLYAWLRRGGAAARAMPSAAENTRWVVSLEGLAVPARAAILKSLQTRLGFALLESDARSCHPLHQLLHRVRSLARVSRPGAVWSGSWLFDVPDEPAMRALHRDLSRELAARLLPAAQTTRHILVVLDADPDEAFETLMGADVPACQNAREVCLQDLREAKAKLARNAAEADVSPFETRIVHVSCPAFAADNAVTLGAICDRVCAECLKEMACCP